MRKLLIVPLLAMAAPALHAETPQATTLQGGLARWTDANASECGISGMRYPAVDGTCYYPVDIDAKVGTHEIALWNAEGERRIGALVVEARECTETEITFEDDTFIDVSEENRKRAAAEREETARAADGRPDVEPRFTLPLAPPAEGAGTRDRSDFCERRLYNDKIRSRHTGLDYLIGPGVAVNAPADGTVVLAADHFYTGKMVMVDHGGGLVTMVFHLGDIAVETGDEVESGDKLGEVGSTGRSTGPHLHFGARWHDQRIDAAALLGDPSRLPTVGSEREEAPDVKAVEKDVDTTNPEDAAGED